MKYSFGSNICYTLSKAMKYNKKLVPRMLVYTISAVMLPVLTVYFPKLIIDEVTGSGDITSIVEIMGIFLTAGIVLSYVSSFLQNRTYGDFHEIRCRFMQEYQQKCFGLGLEKVESSDFLNKVNMAKNCLYGSDGGFEGVLRELFVLFGALITIAYYGMVIILFQPLLFLLLLANTVIPYLLSYRSKRYEYSRQEELSFLARKQSYTNELMSDFKYGKEIRLYSMSELLKSLSNGLQQDIMTVWEKILSKRSMAEVANLLIAFCREGLVYLFLVAGVLSGRLSIGDFALYTGIFASFSSLMTKIIESVSHVRAESLLISDYRIFMDTPDEEEGEELSIDTKGGCSIDFENVSFSYPGSGRMLFDHLNVHIGKGEKIAIVGMNGAGKSTFVKLLCGFYKPDGGRILLNGTDISRYSRASVLRLFSALFQDISFFSMSVAENVAFREKDRIDGERLESALQKAGLEKKIRSLKNGADTTLTKHLDMDGAELSGGEYQKMGMARTLYKNGAIFILDEPTSALDPLAEEEIYSRFRELTGDRTSLFVTHRLASTRFCDRIFVFRDGGVSEEGSHEELMAKQGEYYELYSLQASYYQEGANA